MQCIGRGNPISLAIEARPMKDLLSNKSFFSLLICSKYNKFEGPLVSLGVWTEKDQLSREKKGQGLFRSPFHAKHHPLPPLFRLNQ